MRLLFFILTLTPLLLSAQINRSATELAKENIQHYLTDKIFRNAGYEPVSYGELKPEKIRNEDVQWMMVHRFKITETEVEADKKISVQKPYDFIFYLDNKMKVIRAGSYVNSE